MDLVPLIELEDDPVPIVMIIGAQLKRAMSSKSHRKIVAELDGCFALSSTTDPQKASVTISNGVISLRRGISPDAKIVIHLDFDNLSEKPSIERLLRHPLFAIQVGKLLEPPLQNWINEEKATGHKSLTTPACRLPSNSSRQRTTTNSH